MYATTEGVLIRTVVGSCVAVSLWDRKRKWGGMNHFLYPEVDEGERRTAQFGDVAVPGLVAMMRDLGCRLEDLTAQVFGGATRMESGGHTLGGQNTDLARRELAGKGIPVVSEDVGGVMGRKLLFDTRTGEVAVLKVHRLRDGDWFGC